ncbi:MAG: TetR/AcrR family transcriptional regulator [Clostridia bacterium]|nr:TetR/AcrR family transcriptional regulator [Clostridia bacterium]
MLKTKGKQTRAEIRNHALLLFAEKGFKKVTMNDICVSTGLSRGGLYRYYSSPAEIFGDILKIIIQGMGDELAKNLKGGKTPTESLDIVLQKLKEDIQNPQTTLTIALIEYCHIYGAKAVESAFSRGTEIWEEFIKYGISQGEFNDINPKAMASTILILYEGARAGVNLITYSEDFVSGLIDCIRYMIVKKPEEK